MNELNIDDQKRRIEEAQDQRKLNIAAFDGQGSNIRNRLNSILEECTTDNEKMQMN